MRSQSSRRIYLPEDLAFRLAVSSDYLLLYRLLEERYAEGVVNIDGMAAPQLPTYAEHVRFLQRHPYARLEMILADNRAVGMWYLTRENVGGCFVLKTHLARGVGLAACYRFLHDCRYPVIAHFNPDNRRGWRTVERLGFVRTATSPTCWTYELYGPPINPFRKHLPRTQQG